MLLSANLPTAHSQEAGRVKAFPPYFEDIAGEGQVKGAGAQFSRTEPVLLRVPD